MNAGMICHMAFTAKEQRASVRRSKMHLWDGMEHTFMMPSITAEEQTAVWDVVAGYVQEQLLLHKGVRIPTLGCFDVLPTRTQVGNKVVIIQRPVFRLARNLAAVHSFMENRDDLPGDKVLEPLKYAKVATDASVSRRKVDGCILGTTSLLSHCLGKGENVALVLRDVGVLLIEGKRVQMRFYYDFLKRITGKKVLESAAFKVPQLLDMVLSRMVPIASLTFTGRVIIFPKFELEVVPKPTGWRPPKALRKVPSEDKWKENEGLPPLGQDMEVGLAELPLPARSSLTSEEHKELRDQKRLPATSEAASGKKQPVTSQPKGKPAPKGRASKQRRAQAPKPRRCRGREQGGKKGPVRSKLPSTSSEARMPEEPTYAYIPLPPGPEIAQLLKARPETFWSVLKEPQKTVLAGYIFEPSLLVPPMYQCSPGWSGPGQSGQGLGCPEQRQHQPR
ncbi:uncharacterized protein LJ206_002209 isoform 2-T2 [Theristicus caerulescens]